jgi:hypothetical protein
MHEVIRHIRNTGMRPLSLWIEPWAHEVVVPPGATYRLVGRAEHVGEFEFKLTAAGVTIYGWPSSVFQLYCDEQLLDESPVPVPGIPAGTSMASFVGMLFGGRDAGERSDCAIW